MSSQLGILLYFFRGLRPTKNHIKRFLKRWTSLFAYLVRKMNQWRFLWPSKPGTIRNPKPAESSFPSGREGSSVSDGSVCTGGIGGYVVAASNVPTSAKQSLGRERADPPSDTAPPTPTLTTLPVDPPWAPGPSTTNQIVGSSHVNHSSGSGSLSVQSRASDRLSMISISRRSLRTLPQTDRSSQVPRATYPQLGPYLGPSRSRTKVGSPRSPPQSSLNTPEPENLDISPTGAHSSARADGIINPTIGLQGVTDSLSSHTQEQPRRLAISRPNQMAASVGRDIQNPSSESLPTTSINAQVITEEPMVMDTPTHIPLHISLSDRAETASLNPHTISSVASVLALPEGRILQLITSDQIPRYTKNATTSREGKLKFVDPLTTTFPYFSGPKFPDQTPLMRDCSPWMPATHPDGALYFYDPERRLFTDTDMHDPLLREEMEDFYSYLMEIVRVDLLTIPSKNYDLVLDVTLYENKLEWSYYYACHDTRCLFWLDAYDTTYITLELDGVESLAHLRHRMESFYWNHWSLFPVVFMGRSLPLGVYDELMRILVHGCVDVMTSRVSTLPYNDDQMQKMMLLVQKAKEEHCVIGGVNNEGGMENCTAAIARLLSFFAHWRFLYFHGQKNARLCCDQTAYDTPKRKRTALVSFLSPLLFFGAEVHRKEMEKLWADEFIVARTWNMFMTKRISEWNDLILWSTVVLALNVGFLSIPSIAPSSVLHGTLSISRQMTSLSLLVSIGSILIGLVLVWHTRTIQHTEPEETWDDFFQNSRRYFGLDMMAIVFSLPLALFIWSTLLFLTAVILYSWSISNLWSRIAIASISGFVFSLIGCMWAIWGSSDGLGMWLGGLRLSVSPAQRASRVRIAGLRHAIISLFRRYPVPSSEHELAGRGDGLVGGGV